MPPSRKRKSKSRNYFDILARPTADQDLPSFVWIDAGLAAADWMSTLTPTFKKAQPT